MQAGTSEHPLLCAALAALALGATPAPTAQDTGGFRLAQAVPEDVFLFTAARANPERRFLSEYWGEVWQALLASDAPDDLLGLVLGGLGEEQHAEAVRVRERFVGLATAIEWSALFGGETAFAERLSTRLPGRPGAPVTPAEYVFLLRTEPEVVARGHAGLEGLLEALVEEVRRLGGKDLRLDRSERGGVALTSLDATRLARGAPGIPLSIGRSGEVLFLCLGEGLRDEVAGLLAGAPGGRPLAASARFRGAFERLGPPEDALSYFDMRNLREDLRAIADAVFGALAEEAQGHEEGLLRERMAWIASARGLVQHLLGSMGLLDHVASVETTDGWSTRTDSIAVLAPGAERNPLYPLFAGRPPAADLDRWLPRETTSFALDGGLSLEALYAFVEGTIRAAGKPGDRLWSAWTDFQEERGFDLREDLLAWLDTATVRASFEHEGRDAWILFVKVRQDEAARAALARGLGAAPALVADLAERVPPLAVLEPRLSVPEDPGLEGFHGLAVGPMVTPVMAGVRDGWLMLASSEGALRVVLATAAGEHESVLANEALMARALVGEGPLASVSFRDRRQEGREAASLLGGALMVAGVSAASVPDPELRRVLSALVRIASRLPPVLAKIDFIDSSASSVRFDGKAWRTRTVTRYVPPERRAEGSHER